MYDNSSYYDSKLDSYCEYILMTGYQIAINSILLLILIFLIDNCLMHLRKRNCNGMEELSYCFSSLSQVIYYVFFVVMQYPKRNLLKMTHPANIVNLECPCVIYDSWKKYLLNIIGQSMTNRFDQIYQLYFHTEAIM